LAALPRYQACHPSTAARRPRIARYAGAPHVSRRCGDAVRRMWRDHAERRRLAVRRLTRAALAPLVLRAARRAPPKYALLGGGACAAPRAAEPVYRPDGARLAGAGASRRP